MHLLSKELLELFSCTYTYPLEHGTTVPNDDSLLGVARHINDCTHSNDILRLLEVLYINLYRIWNLFLVIQ